MPDRAITMRAFAASVLLAIAGLFFVGSSDAWAGDDCPPIADKPGAVPHVDYNGVQHLTYCYGPVTVKPGQNTIRLRGLPADFLPQQPGYITRFDPELVYPDGSVPAVDVLHLHHAVWVVNGAPQFAVGEEKTVQQLPRGFGWRSQPSDSWFLNDMLHDLVGEEAQVYVVWRVDFVPDTAPAAANIKTVRTRWLDVSGPSPRVGTSSGVYPIFDALRGMGDNGRYTFPDDATPEQEAFIGPNQTWTPSHPVTLIGSAGHVHPGGLKTQLRVQRGQQEKTLFNSNARYWEPAGPVSWDVAMGGTPRDWRVRLRTGDELSVHATYDTSRADWYEVMGIMPVAVYDGTNVGGQDAFAGDLPKQGPVTHDHLAENDNHGGQDIGLWSALDLPDGPMTTDPINISRYTYAQGDLYTGAKKRKPPIVERGDSLTYKNLDAAPSINSYHTLTSCKAPCNKSTGIAYPIANGPVSFDSEELGFNTSFGAPAADRDTWETPKNLQSGTYNYFCRIHPFMRGSFRVVKPS